MVEIVIAIMEWQTPAFLSLMVCVLLILKLIKADSKWYKISFWSMGGFFSSLLCAEIIYLTII